jgi:checkpoint serine/threonine-protein kinase
MSPHRSDGTTSTRDRERQKYKSKLITALNDEDDPLAVYHQFVQWTIKNYGEADPNSGLVDLLKEVTMQFKEDELYKTDLRYLKMWALHARQAKHRSEAIGIYADLVANDIGTSYSALYEDYAGLLEGDGRCVCWLFFLLLRYVDVDVISRWQEAEAVYRKGIKRSARPLERLKTRYREFQSRVPSSLSVASPSSSSPSSSDSSKTVVQRHPPRARAGPSSGSSRSSPPPPAGNTTFTSTAASRYALMLAPPAPGKRPEKLRFNLSLLFTEGVEYSIQEARARSKGLFGKKWGPPADSEFSRFSSSSSSSALVQFKDDEKRSSRLKPIGRKSLLGGGAEPTVTINTKEALDDVFGMYNSPEKTNIFMIPGSKHAPLKNIDPMTPIVPPRINSLKGSENVQNQNAITPHSGVYF